MRRTTEGLRSRVVVVAEGGLVAETIVVALHGEDFDAVSLPLPRGRAGILEARRTFEDDGTRLGVVVAEVDDVDQWRDVLGLVEGVRVPWILVTGSTSLARWGGLLAGGCVGVVRMSAGMEGLACAVRSVLAEGPAMDQVEYTKALAAWHDLGSDQREVVSRLAALSQREWEVLGCLSDGLSTAKIAERDGVSEGTVRSQVRAIRQKLNVRSQLAAVAAYQTAMEFGSV